MITIKLDKHTAEDIEAIQTLREFGYSDEEIQELYDAQKRKDEKEGFITELEKKYTEDQT